ncbi:leucyl aminopeptidase [Brachybacterium sp. EF45031]|uniref:leucyl aminopeptidase n=1 Tax=Brachybacterium sillae TaxID=2810536 RepID=UPI00217F0D3B|nr:leucyl aminopeptidase [Brachybacterium sillae]MCS6710711.1 leucyl aminopeptidase [Brachybacterium sillae]
MPDMTLTTSAVSEVDVDLLILPVLTGAAEGADPVVLGVESLSAAAAAVGVTGARGEQQLIPGGSEVRARAIALVGLGASDLASVELEDIRHAVGGAARTAAGRPDVAVVLPGGTALQLAAAAEGAALGAYAVTAHRTTGAKPAVERIQLVLSKGQDKKAAAASIERARILADTVNITRDLVNTPPNLLYPAEFARRAQELATGRALSVTVLDEKQLQAGGYGGIVGVGQGSARPPRLVTVDYTPKKARGHVALVGKGITFDTGGISLKPPAGMDEMTSDMTGAATVLAAVIGAARMKLPIRVTALLALAENMPGGGAQRPGDVVTMRNGRTVEVLNTDAEGRLVMADALVDAAALEPDLLLDVATLTGAATVALGKRVAAVMGHDEPRAEVVAAAEATGEPFWPMPLPQDLEKEIKGRIADLKNVGERWGGALTAGLFLREFVGDTPWAHLDIAGPAFSTSAHGYLPAGGTGMSVRTLLEIIEKRAA